MQDKEKSGEKPTPKPPERRRCLVSVTNKSGLDKLTPLVNHGWEFISTGGTAKALRAFGIPVIDVSEVTGMPEMLDGRVKTLHPNVAGGILAIRDNRFHMMMLKKHEIVPIDMVIVNLYDFEGKPGIEEIDIGGPTMLRAAAKNGRDVIVVIDPDDYRSVVTSLVHTGDVGDTVRESLVIKVFEHTSRYDAHIEEWMRKCRAKKIPFLIPPETATPHA